jgi:hypothetical protein
MSTEGDEEGWEYYDDNEVLPDFWQVRHLCMYRTVWMGSSRVVRASNCLRRSYNSPGFDPSILRHSGIGAADEAVLNKN